MFKILEIFATLSVNVAQPVPQPPCFTECSVYDTCEMVASDEETPWVDARWQPTKEVDTSDDVCPDNSCELEY